MKIVVIGGNGLIGSKLVTKLRERGRQALAASPASGVNTLTGEGLAAALEGAAVVVDVSNSPSFDAAVLEFFKTSTRNLLDAESAAGAGHHVVLSVVGADRLPDSGYLRAKVAQEMLVEDSPIPYSIVHATQFFEFVGRIADEATSGTTMRLAHVLIPPPAAARRGRRYRRPASERCHRDRWAAAISPRRARPQRTAQAALPPRGDHRPARALLRRRTTRTLPRPGRRRPPRHDPLRGLAEPAHISNS